MNDAEPELQFSKRLRSHESLVGTWIKTPSPVICEVLARTGLDVLVLDAEHAPFGRAEIDSCIAIARALGKPTLVRVPDASPATILNALDCGAAGILVPHVTRASEAEHAVRCAHYGPGGRGYAGSTRAASFGGTMLPRQLVRARESTSVILQIEDAEALDNLVDIARVPGVSAIFVGRVDLTVSLGKTSIDDPEVMASVERIVRAGGVANCPVGMYVANLQEIPRWRELGVNFYVLASDHNFLQTGARSLLTAVGR